MIHDPENLARRTVLTERERIRYAYSMDGFIRPQILILTPHGVWLTALDRPEIGQDGHFAVLRKFIQSELSPGFCVSWMAPTEGGKDGDVIFLAAITHWGKACGRMTARAVGARAEFGDVEWVDESHIQPAILTLLTKGPSRIDPEDLQAFEVYFHPRGTHPIWNFPIESSEVTIV